YSVSGAGDVNHDGFADVIVGAPFMAEGGHDRGDAYVIFGSANVSGSLTVNNLGNMGLTLRGFEDSAAAGGPVAGVGDVNHDGFDDVAVGALTANVGGPKRGESYVVFGGSGLGGASLALNNLGSQGFTLRGFEDGAQAGNVSRAGDVNGDGIADVV